MADEESPDFLSQSDIDRLMAEASQEPQVVVFNPEGERYSLAEGQKVESYDFWNPIIMSELELRDMRIRHEEFLRFLAARLSIFLRMELGLKLSRLGTMTYGKFTEGLPNPSHITLFKIENHFGVGAISVPPRLAATIVDRMLGGKGHSVKNEGYLTEIETNLFEDIVNVVLEEWSGQWEEIESIKTSVIGRETNGRFLQTSPRDSIMLLASLETGFGDCNDTILLAVPYATVEPFVKKIEDGKKKESDAASADKSREWRPSYNAIRVELAAEWDAAEPTVAEVLKIQPGDVIPLDPDIVSKTFLRVGGSSKFMGTIGLEGDSIVVRVDEKFEQEA